MIHWLWPWALLLLPLPLLMKRTAPPPRNALRLPICTSLLARTRQSPWQGRKALAALLLWALLVSALARPVWVDPDSPPLASGRDLLLVLDASGSMRQMDFEQGGKRLSRFELMQASALRFLAARRGDRVGLILFGDRAHLRAPPTWDHEAVAELIREARVALAGESTALGDALGLAIKYLRHSTARNKVVVLITDGANNEGLLSPRQAARLAKALGIRVHTIGIGRPEGPAPNPWGVWSAAGAERYERALLQAMAHQTGGRFAHALDAKALEEALAAIDRLEPTPAPDLRLHLGRPLHPWLLGLALPLILYLGWRP